MLKALLDLNNPTFQENLLNLQKPERHAALNTLDKNPKIELERIILVKGLKLEKIHSNKPPEGVDAVYSLRITKARCATAYRDGNFIPVSVDSCRS